MSKKLKGKALEKFEAERDVWQEVLEGVQEIKAGGGRRISQLFSAFRSVRLSSGSKAVVSRLAQQRLYFESRSGIRKCYSKLRDE